VLAFGVCDGLLAVLYGRRKKDKLAEGCVKSLFIPPRLCFLIVTICNGFYYSIFIHAYNGKASFIKDFVPFLRGRLHGLIAS
jgi:hypothetical protein